MASKLPRQVKLFGAVSLLNDFASEMVYPLLPAFVTSVLGAGAAALGALDGAAEFAAALVKHATGRLADRPTRRGPLVVLGYAVAVAVRPLIALTGAAWQVIGLRVVDRVGKGIRTPPRDAIIADATPPELRGRAFGLQRGLDHTGAVLGPLVAWLLLSTGAVDVRGVIAASIVPGVLVLVLAMLAVGRYGGRAVRTAEPEPRNDVLTALPPSRPTALLPIAAFHLLRVPETLIILRAQQLGVPVAAVTVLWAALHVVKAGSSFLGGRLSDRLGPRRTMWLGWASYAALATGFALADGAGQAWVLFLTLGVVSGLTESPERALVAAGAGARQGSGFGAYHAVTGVTALVGGLALGLLYQRAGGAVAFWASAGAGAVLCAAWAASGLRTRRE
ncbi:MAG TPA: MFS transporter [Gemmatimonadales bacterium]